MKNGELVSTVINNARAINKDSHISKRYVLYLARKKAEYLISQKLNDRSIYKDEDLFRTVDCFQLKEDNTVNCGIVEFERCSSLMKSVKKIPKLFQSKYGAALISVSSIDGSFDFKPTALKSFKSKKNRRFASKVGEKYYYVRDGYLYLPDSTIEMVNLTLLAIDEREVDEVNSCSNCDDKDKMCKSAWDYEFICPERLLDVVIKDTVQMVLSTVLRIPEDENPNLDSNQKSRTIQ